MSASDISIRPKECNDEVIVGYQCGVAVSRGAQVFAPGVLAAPAGIVLLYSSPLLDNI